jgi:hypothetical protein
MMFIIWIRGCVEGGKGWVGRNELQFIREKILVQKGAFLTACPINKQSTCKLKSNSR